MFARRCLCLGETLKKLNSRRGLPRAYQRRVGERGICLEHTKGVWGKGGGGGGGGGGEARCWFAILRRGESFPSLR